MFQGRNANWIQRVNPAVAAVASAMKKVDLTPAQVPPMRRPPPLLPTPDLNGLKVNFFFENGTAACPKPLASGAINSKINNNLYAVQLHDLYLSPVFEVGSRVFVEYGKGAENDGIVHGGIVVRVNGNGTCCVMLDNNSFDLAASSDMICLSEGRSKFVNDPAYLDVVEWIRTSGVARRVEQEIMACVLFQRGWRLEKLYLLEGVDVHCMTFIPKSMRMCVLDKSEWQRDHHKQMRQLLKERVKERDFRYRLTKYSGVVSASMAFLGITFAFGWNVKNYRAQQRQYQLSLAVKTLEQCRKDAETKRKSSQEVPQGNREGSHVAREREENAVCQILRELDTAHPRIVVITGFSGCGKTSLWNQALAKEGVPTIFVDIRGNEDTLRGVLKALGVQNVDVCGDLIDFVAEACEIHKQRSGSTPLLYLKLREGSNLKRVYNEAVALACDRRLCHLFVEVPIESLTMSNTTLPRLDFYVVPQFSPSQAFAYTQHTIDSLTLTHFIETVGANTNDLDELFAAVHQRRVKPSDYTNQKLVKAMRHLQAAVGRQPQLRAAVRKLAAFPSDEGQHASADAENLRSEELEDIVLYDPVKDSWLFRSKLLHTAATCII